jgi:hypothetical protein
MMKHKINQKPKKEMFDKKKVYTLMRGEISISYPSNQTHPNHAQNREALRFQ